MQTHLTKLEALNFFKNHRMIRLTFFKTDQKQLPNEYYITGIKTNNRKVVKKIYSDFLKNIEQYICANSGTKAEANDIFQDGLIILFNKIQTDTLVIQSTFGQYLFGICKKLWLRKLNKIKRTNEINEGIVFEIKEENVTDIEIIEREKQKLYEEKFKLLKPSYQKILTLYFEGKSMSEIAQIMGFKSANYASKRKHQCQEYLKELIQNDKRYQELTE